MLESSKCHNQGYTPGFVGIRQLLSKSFVTPLFVLQTLHNPDDGSSTTVLVLYPFRDTAQDSRIAQRKLFKLLPSTVLRLWTKAIPRSFGVISPLLSDGGDGESVTDVESSASTCVEQLSDSEFTPKYAGSQGQAGQINIPSTVTEREGSLNDLFGPPTTPVVNIPRGVLYRRYWSNPNPDVLGTQIVHSPLSLNSSENVVTIRLPGMRKGFDVTVRCTVQEGPSYRLPRRRRRFTQSRVTQAPTLEPSLHALGDTARYQASRTISCLSVVHEPETQPPSYFSLSPPVLPADTLNRKPAAKNAASLLAILNGQIPEPSYPSMFCTSEWATPVDKIASTDDPPLPKPFPIGSRRPCRPSRCSFQSDPVGMDPPSEETLPWPPILPERSFSF